MVGGMNFFRRILAPVGVSALALMIFSGCVAEVEVRRGRYYGDRVWHSDPYCRYGNSWGCRYNYNDGSRIRIIHGRRWGRWMEPVANVEAAKRTTWKSEFGLSTRAVNAIRTAWDQTLDRKPEAFYALGFTRSDARALTKFRMPNPDSVARAAHNLGVKTQDLSDFLEVFTIRMKSAFAANERYE
jgi:hypothetical protein